ncbi:MAG: TRAP transporter large permease subunit, partial [Pseudomonas sp.]|nr:TRAP transporter large permease subunit [Pseudomonas sp.]
MTGEQRLQTVEQAAIEAVGLVQARLVEALIERETTLEQILEHATGILAQVAGSAQCIEQPLCILLQPAIDRTGPLPGHRAVGIGGLTHTGLGKTQGHRSQLLAVHVQRHSTVEGAGQVACIELVGKLLNLAEEFLQRLDLVLVQFTFNIYLPAADAHAAGLTAADHARGLAIAGGSKAALRPTGRGLRHGNTQAVTITGGNRQVEGLRQCTEALAVACRPPHLVRIARSSTAETLVEIAKAILAFSDNPYVILLLINIVLLLLGMFLEPISILILTMPVLLAIQKVIAMDIVQFGTMVVLNVVIGMATPPVGVCLFIVCAISGRPLVEVSR